MKEFQYTPFNVKLIRRHAQTMKPATIAAYMQAPLDMIEMICRKHAIRARDEDVHDFEKKRPVMRKAMDIEVDERLLKIVRREAVKRGLHSHTLIERLIEKIAEDGIFGAVLDK